MIGGRQSRVLTTLLLGLGIIATSVFGEHIYPFLRRYSLPDKHESVLFNRIIARILCKIGMYVCLTGPRSNFASVLSMSFA